MGVKVALSLHQREHGCLQLEGGAAAGTGHYPVEGG
jgi:hypothetical protein